MWCDHHSDACASVGRGSIYINSLSTSTDGRGHPAVLHAELRPQARQRLLLHPAWRVQVNFPISLLQSKSNWSVSGWFSTMLPPRSQVRVCFRDNFPPSAPEHLALYTVYHCVQCLVVIWPSCDLNAWTHQWLCPPSTPSVACEWRWSCGLHLTHDDSERSRNIYIECYFWFSAW